jgi:hypothetical protein
MKLGLIFECGPKGADVQVCEYLIERLSSGIQLKSVTLDNKKRLLRECGKAAATLIEEGCERVAIVWDLCPSWDRKRPCLKKDREAIFDSLKGGSVPLTLVAMVSIIPELEAWLLADETALARVIGTAEHPVRIPPQKSLETGNPKARLKRLFQQHSGRPYVELRHAKMIVEQMKSFSRLKRCPSFVRFAERVAGVRIED